MDPSMREELIAFYSRFPDQFYLFCERFMNKKPIYWCERTLTDMEIKEIYTSICEIFPWRAIK